MLYVCDTRVAVATSHNKPLTISDSWWKSPTSRVTIITQTLDRMRLCFRIKVRFSDASFVSHEIIHRQRMRKYITCCSSSD